jgi:cell division transport system ATP-binding protein
LIIQMAGVSKLYQNGVSALQDINVSIEKGEFVFLIGQSGAGKTTFSLDSKARGR